MNRNGSLFKTSGVDQAALDMGEILKPCEHLVMGHCGFSVVIIDCHLLPVLWASPDRFVDHSLIVLQGSVNDRLITAVMECSLSCAAMELWARSFLHAMMTPVVSISILWTIPGRRTPLIPERSSLQ
jgi:hypothetical protein